MKTVGLTYDSKTDYKFKEGDPLDANAEFDHPDTIGLIAQAITTNGFRVERIGNVSNLLEKLGSLNVDIVFNISEGMFGRNRESQVPAILEMAGIPFVGADALTLGLTLDKVIAKKIFIADKIPTPNFFEVNSKEQLNNTNHYKFPLIVKPRFEGSSKGLSENSRVQTKEELDKQVEYVINAYKQPALIEEFISGQEFTVAIIGNDEPEIMPVVQIKIDGKLKLNDKFYTFARITSDRLEYVCPAKISVELKKVLDGLALRVYRAVECRDFGRVDFRVDQEGRPYVLEINPLPSLSKEDVFMLLAKAVGITYEQMIGKILDSALKRYNFD
ncbi:MAG: D-alanine--D-alanine ligase [Candidatus Omnitrophica bacterium CG08_land_8_20_14_0_20_41_16]|uniref:D-alanine--D-alanine ligase n=1 Tax=Candidatus Sherwoodlollariibacterium unditelluris TaxID=1974757 RepID=A0A2G9YKJ8_9BACT|nr:MAG: D-alanine--D-alanine ligase [Candidatus Omnitrophica bacterium CG23_combo_of_CG06-09_8_20_14_all_41_10]PIS34088.1 MAG: D-alanine--D-alanine ligase [Candidatus Omnitrophica bacterium CG08_land_8_20_14_0_20_41_16]